MYMSIPTDRATSAFHLAIKIWAMVDIDPALLSDEVERVNITLPKRILARLDSKALQYGKTRSGLIADLALRVA